MFGITQLKDRVDRLEARARIQDDVIRQLSERLGIDPIETDPLERLDPAEEALVREGRIIEAVKHHRERTGSTLLFAKNAVDNAKRGL